MEAVKTTNKLHSLDENHSTSGNIEEMFLDLGWSFYKLHFQHVVLIEAENKMLIALMNAAKNSLSPLQDVSTEILIMKMALSKALEESNESEQGTQTQSLKV